MGIVDSGTAYRAAKNETVTFNGNRALDSFYLFICVIAIVAQSVTPLRTLCVQGHDCTSRILFALTSYLHDKLLYAMLQMSLIPPFVEVPIDGLPFREIMREHTPLATADKDEEYRFKQGTKRIFAMPAIIFKEYFDYIISLTLGQMCLIEVFFMHIKLFFFFKYSD